MQPDAFKSLSPAEAAALTQSLPTMSVEEKIALFDMLEEREKRDKLHTARASTLGLAHHVYPGFKEGAHHRVLSKVFEDVMSGRKKRVIINIAPRMGKSEFGSYLFPAHFIGTYPEKKIIMGTHTSGLSEDFGRRVKNLVDSEEMQELYPGTTIASDQKAAGKWSTSQGGQYYAVGVGGSIAGRGADLFVIDDPHSEQSVKANSTLAFDSAWSWYQQGPLQRLMPGGAILIIMCMTGDTDVLRADGTLTKLRDIRPGDEVATYEAGKITTSRITNWKSSGVDSIHTIRTFSGRIIRANERHPFLVDHNGERKWIRLNALKPGMWLVATGKSPRCLSGPLSTYVVTLDEIVSIQPEGREEVFDVEVERTENFIANGVVSHNTRWSTKDLTGRLLAHQAKNPGSDVWEVIELPAILHEGTEREKSLWPEQWPLEELQGKKAGMDPRYWNAQYMQQPTSDNSAIIARTAWQVWPHEEPPKVEFVIQSWDTAFEAKQSADYSACTTWGVWYDEERNSRPSLILLDAFKDRMEFPELKATALKHYKEWKPDAFIVEKKAAGAPLIQELRRAGIPVQEFSPSRGNDKIVRLNAVSDLFATGTVWAPDTRWAKEVIEEVASFPNGDNDDYVDTVSQALLRYRQGGFIPLDSDEQDESEALYRHRQKAYY